MLRSDNQGSIFCIWLFSYPSTICWKFNPLSIELLSNICQKLTNCIYMYWERETETGREEETEKERGVNFWTLSVPVIYISIFTPVKVLQPCSSLYFPINYNISLSISTKKAYYDCEIVLNVQISLGQVNTKLNFLIFEYDMCAHLLRNWFFQSITNVLLFQCTWLVYYC